eukprot:Partr_v1_DN24765_c0_g1_i1_m37133
MEDWKSGIASKFAERTWRYYGGSCCWCTQLSNVAGSDFSVISIVNSSKTEILRMPMNLLTQSDVETAICSIPNEDQLLLQPAVRRHLFYLGVVSRWVTEFVLELLDQKIPPVDFRISKPLR